MLTVDVIAGSARDHGQVFIGNTSDPKEVIIDIDVTDEDELSLSWGEGAGRISVYVPTDRVKALLEGEK